MKELRDRRVEFNRLDSLVFEKLGKSAVAAASAVLDPAFQPLVLRFGSYSRCLYLALTIEKELKGTSSSVHSKRDRLRLLAAEMALYLDREREFLDVALKATSHLARSSELAVAARKGWLISSRLAGRLNRIADEERFLEKSSPSGSTLATGESWNWCFRALAFYKKTRRYDDFDSLTKLRSCLSGNPDVLTQSNIQSEIARVHLYRGNIVAAYDVFRQVFDTSIRMFHLRGIVVTALFLAKTAMAAEDYCEAAKALLLSDQIRARVARNKEKADYETLRISLERLMGREQMVEAWMGA
ncbi:MAG: hypothetical protein V1792_29365 [Pseudomonadota bacterium]